MAVHSPQMILYKSLIIILLLFSSCAQSRLNRLLDRHPELRQTEKITIRDTILVEVPGVSADTSTNVITLRDTVEVKKGNLSVKVWTVPSVDGNPLHDTVYIEGKCDTIYLEVPYETEIEVEKIIYKQSIDKLIWLFVIIAVCVVIYQLFYGRRRPRDNLS
jgi:hypothetical protein